MADQTPRLQLPFMSTAQSNKELTFNQLAAMVDALISARAIDRGLNVPPATPDEGDLYIVGTAPTGLWAGKADNIAYFIGSWQFIAPEPGWLVWVEDESSYYRYITPENDWVPTLVIPVEYLADLLDVTVGTPGAPEDGYALAWDNATSRYTLQPGQTELAGLSDINVTGITDGQSLAWDATGLEFVAVDLPTSFLGLTDVPSIYTGAGGLAVVVKADETGLEFAEVEGGAGASTFVGLLDTPDNYVGLAGLIPTVNGAEDGLEFVDLAALTGGLPPAGLSDQVLRKVSGVDYDTEWVDLNTVVPVIPTGGLTAQVLAKVTDDDGDVAWVSVPIVPLGGTTGQFLTKVSDLDADVAWADLPPFPDVDEVPGGGTAGQVLTKDSATDGDYSWQTPAAIPPYSIPFGFTTAPTNAEILLIAVFAEAVTLPDNFTGARSYVGINPTATATLTIQKNGADVGTISITSAGVVAFNTTGTTVVFGIGDRITVIAQAVADLTLANCAFTLIGTRN